MAEKSWLDETREFFFKGACAGWAGGNSGSVLRREQGTPGMEDWREVICREPLGFAGFCMADRWGPDPDSGRPSGSIHITHWDIPVWVMWIGGGSYEETALPFLRRALMENYRRGEFCGGRGPAEYRDGEFRYFNTFTGDFQHFGGHEHIVRTDEEGVERVVGSHSYWGGSLAFLSGR